MPTMVRTAANAMSKGAYGPAPNVMGMGPKNTMMPMLMLPFE